MMYQAVLSIETYLVVKSMIESMILPLHTSEIAVNRRNKYHIVIVTFNIGAVLLIILGGYAEPYGLISFICYTSNKLILSLCYLVPYFLSVFIMMTCNIKLISILSELYYTLAAGTRTRDSRNSSSDMQVAFITTFERLDARGKNTVLRLLILPLLYLSLAVFIGLYVVVYSSTSARVPALGTTCAAISSPIINCIVWVLSDSTVMRVWFQYITCSPDSISILSLFKIGFRTSDFEGPLSSYTLSEDHMRATELSARSPHSTCEHYNNQKKNQNHKLPLILSGSSDGCSIDIFNNNGNSNSHHSHNGDKQIINSVCDSGGIEPKISIYEAQQNRTQSSMI
mgnify:CR=1 FL=1